MEQSKSHWKSIWWPESDESDEEADEDKAEEIEGKIVMEEEGEDQEKGG